MTTSILLVLGGLVLLIAGGEWLVRAACALAQKAGMSPAVVGLTVVAAGTSMPELLVSVQASLAGSSDLAMGNVVGSNIFNIALILGVAALIAPLKVTGQAVRVEWPIMLTASLLIWALARDGKIARIEGGLLVLLLVIFVTSMVWLSRKVQGQAEREEFATHAQSVSAPGGWLVAIVGVIGGCVLLGFGAEWLIRGASDLARHAGVSEAVIGLTIVAAGTSLPELTASCIASVRGHNDVAIANVLGSNIFNILGIAGTAALIQPMGVSAILLERDMLWMIAISVVLFPLLRSGMRINRLEAAGLLTLYGSYLWVLLHA